MNLSALKKALAKDGESRFPKHSKLAAKLLELDEVSRIVGERLKAKHRLHRVYEIEYHFRTGLIFTCFDFESAAGRVEARDLLVITDGNCALVGIVDPFDAAQPNPHVPPLPDTPKLKVTGPQTFIRARPSLAEDKVERLKPIATQVRDREFFEQLQMEFSDNDPFGTSSSYETDAGTTRVCKARTATGPDFGMPDLCDLWEERDMVTTDYATDDSG